MAFSTVRSLDLNTRRDQLRRMLASVLEEPVYLAFASELRMECDGELAAMSSPGMSSLIKEAMPDAFRGFAPAMMIVDEPLRRLPQTIAAAVLDAHVVHEASHIVNTMHVDKDCPHHGLNDLVQTRWQSWPNYSGLPLWSTHDLRFVRGLCHIAHRFESRGHALAMPYTFQHERYGLSPIETYQAALGDEPRSTSWLPVREVLAKPMPDAFVTLWSQDVVKSLRSN